MAGKGNVQPAMNTVWVSSAERAVGMRRSQAFPGKEGGRLTC